MTSLCLALINNALNDVISDEQELREDALSFFRSSPIYHLTVEALGLGEGTLPAAFDSDPRPLDNPEIPRIARFCHTSRTYKIHKIDNP